MDVVSRDGWDENHAWPDRAIAELAARQQTIVAHAQLRALGAKPRTIAAARARGRLHPVHHGVSSLVPPSARPPLAAEHAALLACGPTAVLSHHTAANLHGLHASFNAEVHVTVPATDRRRPGLIIHRTTTLHPQERIRVSGLPVTSVARTVIDLAPTINDRALERLIDRALKKTSRTKLTEALVRHHRRPGTPRVAALLDPDRPSSDTWSKREERLLRLIRHAGLAAPEVNVVLGPYIPDLLWRDQRVIVEYDSYDHHSGPAAFHHDRDRHNHFVALDYQVIHVTGRQLTARPAQVLAWIAAALALSDRDRARA
jgi:very-short-patch-repair endonuclease